MIDSDPGRLASANQHGADDTVLSDAYAAATITEMTNGLGAQVVFDFAGVNATLALATTIVAT